MVTITENMQGQKFGPIGKCIYCGSDGGPDGLSSEHIVPFALGGKAELLEASCSACGGVTSYIDGYLSRHIYYDLRLSMPKIPTRDRKRHPKTRSMQITFAGREEVKDFETGDHPFFTILPIWNTPGILRIAQPSVAFPPSQALNYTYVPEGLADRLELKAGEQAKLKSAVPLNMHTFGRAIAKIAYCQAVASFGLEGFRKLSMADLILGRYPCVSYFVGNLPEPAPPPDRTGLLHSVRLEFVTLGRLTLIVATLRLFANCGTSEVGMPMYQVVVGAPRSLI